MLAVADTALDLLVLQLVLHGLSVGVLALVLGVLAPVEGRLENDVLADRGGVGGRAGAVLDAEAEFGPRLAFSDAGVDNLTVGDVADASCGLDLLAVVVQAVLDDGRAAILVGDLLRGREFGGGLLELVIVGPVVPEWSRTMLDSYSPRNQMHTCWVVKHARKMVIGGIGGVDADGRLLSRQAEEY